MVREGQEEERVNFQHPTSNIEDSGAEGDGALRTASPTVAGEHPASDVGTEAWDGLEDPTSPGLAEPLHGSPPSPSRVQPCI